MRKLMEKEENKTREWYLSFADVKHIIRQLDDKKECESILDKLSGTNLNRVQESIAPGRDSFLGATWKDSVRQLNNGVDDFAEWVKRSKLEVNVETLRRRRVKKFSDIEGDVIDVDRLRYSDHPLLVAKKIHVNSPIIKLMVSCSFSCANTARDITTYGIKIYEIVNILEAMGKTVELNVYYHYKGLWQDESREDNWDFYGQRGSTLFVRIKEAGEYIEPSHVATTLTSFFFRRITWPVFAILGQKDNLQITSYMGYPRNIHSSGRFNTDIFYLNGDTLYIEPNDAHSFSTAMIDRAIKLANTIGITNEMARELGLMTEEVEF